MHSNDMNQSTLAFRICYKGELELAMAVPQRSLDAQAWHLDAHVVRVGAKLASTLPSPQSLLKMPALPLSLVVVPEKRSHRCLKTSFS